jgi:hexosaminidase
MNKTLICVSLLLVVVDCTPPAPLEVNVIPQPNEILKSAGRVKWSDEITISAQSEEEKAVAGFLAEFLVTKGVTAQISLTETKVDVTLRTEQKAGASNEAYQLEINDKGVLLVASSGAGLFYGVQTLFQLIQGNEGVELPHVKINDAPRFAYRGLHLDVGRHFFPVEFVKRYIDLMAHFKLNTFHWHLTEDHGWRIEIKKYPRLQEIAAYRKETVIGRATTRTRNELHEYDGTRHGGYYTQEEIKDVVAYAASRYITVIPEIELPGHALAALAAYPQLGCTGGPYEVATTWGIFNEVFCAGKESTFLFLQDVLDEVIPLFPGKYVHIGGDECFKDSWKKCQHCQKRMKAEKLKDEHELQSYFIQRIEKYVNSKGKSIIGWDEILEGGLAPNATVMSWRGEEGGIAAAQQNHDVIMTPSKWLYLDYMQDSASTEPLAVRVLVDTKTIYGYDPVPASFTPEQAKHVLGLQANVWTEYMKTGDHVEYMVYPRAIALAEVGWSKKEQRSYEDFVNRLSKQRSLLDSWKVTYAKHVFE